MNTKQVKIIVGENEHEYMVEVDVFENENVKDILLKATNKVVSDIDEITSIYNSTGEYIANLMSSSHASVETTSRYIK